MSSEDKMDLMRRGMEAFGRGDTAVFRETMSEDVVWHLPGTSPLAGDHRGRDAVADVLVQTQERTGGAVEPMDMLVGDNFLMVFTRFQGAKDGEDIDMTFADAVRFNDDGLLAEYWSVPNDPEAWDAALS